MLLISTDGSGTVSIIVPVIIFLALQLYFVRGLLAGGLKG